jgi:diguanylate cyclase (GGDEF)-like protein
MSGERSASRFPGGSTNRGSSEGSGTRSLLARATRRWGVKGILLLAVMLPTAALGVAVSVLLSERYQIASQARSIARKIPAVTSIVSLHALIDQERIQTETRLREAELGGSRMTSITSTLGLGGGTVTSARAAVDAQLSSHDVQLPTSFEQGLAALRREVDGGRANARQVDQGYARLSDELTGEVEVRLSGLRRLTARTSKAAALDASLATLQEANAVLSAGSNEVGTLSDVYLDGEPQRSVDLGALGVQVPLFDTATDQLLGASSPNVRSAFAALDDSAAWQGYQAAAAAAVAGKAPSLRSNALAGENFESALANGSLLQVIGPLLSGWTGMQKVYVVVKLAAADARTEAAKLQASGDSAFRNLVLEAILGVGLTIVVALLLARLISRPLRRLEEHARAVSAGNLDLPRLPPSGPKETLVASHAFNDLVANLRLLEAKARTLAACTFDDPILDEVLPGRLGQALEQSITVLSGSIVEREQLQKRLAHEATHDSLTGLHNRAAAVEYLDQALARAGRSGRALAVMFIDLDDFKRANDIYGHAVGDVILISIAERISSVARGTDFVARLGGDEFIVISEGLDEAQEAITIASRLVETLGAPVDADGMIISVTASVGIAYALDGAADEGSQLLARADMALYRAKRSDHSSVEVYDEALRKELIRHAEVEKDLLATLEDGGKGLFLEYQPLIDTRTGEFFSVEALIRWERPGHGRCQPDAFIPVAESSDLIVQLDKWVLGTVLAQQRTWSEEGLGSIPVAVNISGRHLLTGRLVEHVTTLLEASGADPTGITLELTETVLLTDLPSVALDLERLRDLGLRIAIDDFGTGYTSLAHLQHLTVDAVKIDRSFTSQLPAERDRRLIELVTDVGHQLGLSVVAEGVENEDQLAELREIGCDRLQGFLIARPFGADQVAAWQRSRQQAEPGLPLAPGASAASADGLV